jgi:hypothetical protein
LLWLYGVARRVLANERRAARRRSAASTPPLLEAVAALRPLTGGLVHRRA